MKRGIVGIVGTVCSIILALAMTASTACAQAFPQKPVRLIVPYPPGGPLDISARFLAEAVRPTLGTVVVENRPGAGGNIGADAAAKSTPDGYTLLIGAVATHAINPWLYPKMPYDPLKDFEPITLIANVPNVLVVNEEFARKNDVKSVADFVAFLKAKPGKTQFASGGNGSAGHLAGELFKILTDTASLHVPYRGAAPAQLALLAGEVDFMFDNLASAAPRIREGKLRPLAVTTARRAANLAQVPALAESGIGGLKDFDISTWFGLFAPAGTPKDVLAKLHAEFSAALKTKAVHDQLGMLGAEPAPSTSAEFSALIRRDLKKYQTVVKQSGAKID